MRAEKATLELVRRVELGAGPLRDCMVTLRDDEIRDMLARGPAYVVLDGDRVVAFIGAAALANGVGTGYAVLGAPAGRKMVAVHRIARRLLEASPFRRLQVVTGTQDRPGARWARALGFEHETKLRSWFADGDDAEQFVLIRQSAAAAAALHCAEVSSHLRS